MTTLVTGATGYLGGCLIRHLASRGDAVRALVRRSDAALPAGVEPLIGDVTDRGSLRPAVRSCRRVYHTAALVSAWEKDPSRFDAVNVQGTLNVVDAATEAGVERILYTSSFIVSGPTDGLTFAEDDFPRRSTFYNDYDRSKYLARRAALERIEAGAPTILCYPGVVYGPGAWTEGNLVGQLLRDFLAGKVPGLLGGGHHRWCFAYNEDVVEGMRAAMERGSIGRGYILGGENRSLRELFELLSRLAGRPAPRRSIPYGIAKLLGGLQVLRARLGGKRPQITPEVVEIWKHEWAYSSDRAVRELDYRITPLDEGLAETVSWVREQDGGSDG